MQRNTQDLGTAKYIAKSLSITFAFLTALVLSYGFFKAIEEPIMDSADYMLIGMTLVVISNIFKSMANNE